MRELDCRREHRGLRLDRATELGRVLFSRDEDLLAEATRRQRRGESFGVIYAPQLDITMGGAVNDLEVLALAGTKEDFAGRVEYLPF